MKRLMAVCASVLMLLLAGGFAPAEKFDADTQEPECWWELAETTEAMSGGDGSGKSASSSGNSITTTFFVPGSDTCGEMTFISQHTWTEPGYYLTPGEILTFDVQASWSANGESGCQSMVTGVNTWVAAGATTIKTDRGKINVSTEPSGSVSSSGEWTVPGGSEGQTFSIRAHGEQGGAGGTVFYKYVYTCGKATTAEGNCEPVISNISGLTPGMVLSPAADFVDEEGKATSVIGSAWLINGVETPSVVWDGKETVVELQYTCGDHSGHSRTIIIPAYDGKAVDGMAAGGKDADDDGGGVSPAAAGAGLAVGAAGTAISVRGLTKKKTSKPEKKKQKAKKEKKSTRKSLLDTEKEAVAQYQETLQKISNGVEKTIDAIEGMHGLSPEGRKRITTEMKKFKASLDNVAETAGNVGDNLEKLQKLRDTVQEIGSKYQRLQKAHMQAFKELEDLPEGAAHQLADLTTAIEGFGLAADSVLKRIPYFNKIYSDEYFQTTQSFKEFSQGVRKTFAKTIFRSAVEGKKELTLAERKAFGEKGLGNKKPPEVEKLIKERNQK